MKNIILSLVVFFLVFSLSCKKIDKDSSDEIVITTINKTILVSKKDSIDGSCKPIIFGIDKIDSSTNQAYMVLSSQAITCDGSIEYTAMESSDFVHELWEGDRIWEKSNWRIPSEKMYLKYFAGLGETYMGFRKKSYKDDMTVYNYGWVKIRLSANMDNLVIVSVAENKTNFNDITAGQTE